MRNLIVLLMICMVLTPFAYAQRTVLVFSKTQQKKFYDLKSYSQLYLSAQYHLYMAGIPFELKNIEDLTAPGALDTVDLLILPFNGTEQTDNIKPFVANVVAAQNRATNPLNIIALGSIFEVNQKAEYVGDHSKVMEQILKVTSIDGDGPVDVDIYENNSDKLWSASVPNGKLGNFKKTWFRAYSANTDANIKAMSLAKMRVKNKEYEAVWAIEDSRNGARVVHFAFPEVMYRTSLLWQTMLWASRDLNNQVKLELSREKSMFVSRTDLDIVLENPSQKIVINKYTEIIDSWKNKYNYVGSHYITVGDGTVQYKWTDWNFAKPKYLYWIETGHEVGTHSCNHPDFVDRLSHEELKYEFAGSRKTIESYLGLPIPGGAIPGNRETLQTALSFEPYLDYISGEYQGPEFGFISSFGRLNPDSKMIYMGPNLLFDFTVIDFKKQSSEDLLNTWYRDFDILNTGYENSIIHWPWHDYAVVAKELFDFRYGDGENEVLEEDKILNAYDLKIFDRFLAYVSKQSVEYITALDLSYRMKALDSIEIKRPGPQSIKINLNKLSKENLTSLGRFSFKVKVPQNKVLNLKNHYAYNDKQIFLAQNSYKNVISWDYANTSNSDTKIIKLPMRMSLVNVDGDGKNIKFQVSGEGKLLLKTLPEVEFSFVCTGNPEVKKLELNLYEINWKKIGNYGCDILENFGYYDEKEVKEVTECPYQPELYLKLNNAYETALPLDDAKLLLGTWSTKSMSKMRPNATYTYQQNTSANCSPIFKSLSFVKQNNAYNLSLVNYNNEELLYASYPDDWTVINQGPIFPVNRLDCRVGQGKLGKYLICQNYAGTGKVAYHCMTSSEATQNDCLFN